MPHVVCSKIKKRKKFSNVLAFRLQFSWRKRKRCDSAPWLQSTLKLGVISLDKLIWDKSQEFNLGFPEGNITF